MLKRCWEGRAACARGSRSASALLASRLASGSGACRL